MGSVISLPGGGSSGGGAPGAPGVNLRGAWRGDTITPGVAYDNFPTTPGQSVPGWTTTSGAAFTPVTADVSGLGQPPANPPVGGGGGGAIRNAYQGGASAIEAQRVFTSTAGNLEFDFAYGTETNYDYVSVTLDGTTVISPRSGYGSWQHFSFPVTAGSHTLRVRYIKDGSGELYMDGWAIANFAVPVAASTAPGPSYVPDDVVYHQGVLWRALAPSQNVAPSKTVPSTWAVAYEDTKPTAGPLSWVPFRLDNGWENYNTATNGVGFVEPGVAIDILGVVHVRGLIRNVTTNSQVVGNAGALPEAFRPTRNTLVLCHGSNGQQEVRFGPDGSIQLISLPGNTLSFSYTSFDGLAYPKIGA